MGNHLPHRGPSRDAPECQRRPGRRAAARRPAGDGGAVGQLLPRRLAGARGALHAPAHRQRG
ncbi:hypothetical protein CU110_03685 [Cobetia sp. ICG0124]|nr:hypothetical protein CU110_03685 [Cobetia sp. ICG0124]